MIISFLILYHILNMEVSYSIKHLFNLQINFVTINTDLIFLQFKLKKTQLNLVESFFERIASVFEL